MKVWTAICISLATCLTAVILVLSLFGPALEWDIAIIEAVDGMSTYDIRYIFLYMPILRIIQGQPIMEFWPFFVLVLLLWLIGITVYGVISTIKKKKLK